MCDIHPHGRTGWRGWPQYDKKRASQATGAWIDLSHKLHNDFPMPDVFPQPRFERCMTMPTDKINVTKIEMVCHTGTHLDAPSHFFMDAPDFHDIPFDKFHGNGVVWKFDVAPFELITAEMLASMTPSLNPGDMVLVDTGWSKKWGTDAYWENPSISEDAADWLVAHGASFVGVDFVSPDLAFPKRGEGFDWPVHKTLLSNGILIAENIANLQSLNEGHVEVVAGALNIHGADGSPARVTARPIEMTS